ncbi:uncharacterized protein LOC141708634 [Apium graveolens]|uniref:uncharacterized protein LOC141708634 n=1 Tax=Apium graveolens TaxID=4045 RepID=UPI003D7A5F9E
MVLRDGSGEFIEGRKLALPYPATVLEAESMGVREALSWVMSRQERRVIVETDSLLTVRAVLGKQEYALEIGHVIEHCKLLLQLLPEVSVSFVRKQANKLAHSLARIPCSIYCYNVFTSLPTHLLETIANDFFSLMKEVGLI